MISVGIDDGYAVIKMAWFPERDSNTLLTHSFPSQVGMGELLTSMTGGTPERAYSTNGQTYTVLPPRDPIDTRFDEYPLSDMNRVLVAHALLVAGLGGKQISLCTGLPPGSYFDSGTGLNDRLLKRKEASLMLPVTAISGEPMPIIGKQIVSAEAVSAAIDYMVDDAGDLVNRIEGMMAVVDIGGRTTDIVTIFGDGDLHIDRGATGSMSVGVLQALDLLKGRIADEMDLPSSELPSTLDVLKTGYINVFGKAHDMRHHCQPVIAQVGEEILRFVQTKIGRGSRYNKILFVGGGAEVFRTVLEKFPSGVIPENPAFANARGMAKQVRAGV